MVDLGVGVGPIILGFVLAATNFGTMYSILAVVVAVASLLCHAVHGKRHGGGPQPRVQQHVAEAQLEHAN